MDKIIIIILFIF